LVRAAQNDPAAFSDIYQRYHARIFRYLRARASTDDAAVDLAAQAFLQAFKALPTYRSRGTPFVAWLFRIARSVAADAHRKARPTIPWDAVPESQHPVDEVDPEGSLVRREQEAEVRALVGRLLEDKREIVLLRFAGDLTLREIAAIVGKRESTVHHHLRAALDIMKEHYRED
jgi:RNA polymerase sigma-70 factor (ECF subfamily)